MINTKKCLVGIAFLEVFCYYELYEGGIDGASLNVKLGN